MSEPSSPQVNRVPQIMLLSASAALIVFLILLGTDVISPDGGLVLIVSSTLFAIGMIATAMEFAINKTGINRKQDTPAPDA